MFKLPVYNREGKSIEEITLDKHIFDGEVNKDVLYQTTICYRANNRLGCASTKTRGEVSGGGSKPWRQKGTGRARAGSRRSPLFRHGGVVFGPHPRDFSYTIPKKIKLFALKSGFNAKLKEGDLTVIDEIKLERFKTAEMIGILAILPPLKQEMSKSSGLVLTHPTLGIFELDSRTLSCMRNIPNLDVLRPQDVTAYDVLRYKKLLVTKDALEKISERIRGKCQSRRTLTSPP